MDAISVNDAAPVPNRDAEYPRDKAHFVTVVSVGAGAQQQSAEPDLTPTVDIPSTDASIEKSFVTVLTIGDEDENDAPCPQVIEEILVYRLPGERLGFGLKFEGGTKTSECVRRLFIQSCAADSPASRVRCSWGPLVEGDEVIQIDSLPVRNMTRIDCVRCLKDSNVVIKLLVKHANQMPDAYLKDGTCRSTENLPLVVSAEKKRVPPPPPPIPPRKVPRKMLSKDGATQSRGQAVDAENLGAEPRPVAPARNTALLLADTDTDGASKMSSGTNVKGHNVHRLQPASPHVSARARPHVDTPLPKVSARDRCLSDSSGGPPDAEVYLDLVSRELEYGFRTESESDDTGSTISTIVDRHTSVPTTSNSSFSENRSVMSDSVPTTPTSIQKQMDLTKVLNPFEILEMEFAPSTQPTDNYLFSKLVSSQDAHRERHAANAHMQKNGDQDEVPLQPPANFQDAPLSYGTEDVRLMIEQNPSICRRTESARDPWLDVDSDVVDGRINIEFNSADSMSAATDSSGLNENDSETVQLPKPTPRKCHKRPSPLPPPVVEDGRSQSTPALDTVQTVTGTLVAAAPAPAPDEPATDQWKVNECEKPNLPRLVNFLPKTPPKGSPVHEMPTPVPMVVPDCMSNTKLDVKTFLKNEILNVNECYNFQSTDYLTNNSGANDDGTYLSLDVISMEKISDFRQVERCDNDKCDEVVIKNMEEEPYFNFKWCSSSHLATIGEDEEEFASSELVSQGPANSSAPIVIVQSADQEEEVANVKRDDKHSKLDKELDVITDEEIIKNDNDNASDVATANNQLSAANSAAEFIKQHDSEMIDSQQVDTPEYLDVTPTQPTNDVEVNKKSKEIYNNQAVESKQPTAETDNQALYESDIDGSMDASNDAKPRQTAFLTSSVQSSLEPPLSSISRMPPDGHEFPSNYEESKFQQSENMSDNDAKRLPPLPKHGPPPLVTRKKLSMPSSTIDDTISSNTDLHRLPLYSPVICENKHSNSSSMIKYETQNAEIRKSSYSSESDTKTTLSLGRRKDDRSAGSVKDKIAIFSSSSDSEPLFPQHLTVDTKLSKTYKSSDDVFHSSENSNLFKAKHLSKSSVSMDKIVNNQKDKYNMLTSNDFKDLSRSTSNTDLVKMNEFENHKQYSTMKFAYPNKTQSSTNLSNTNLTSYIEVNKEIPTSNDKYATLSKVVDLHKQEDHNEYIAPTLNRTASFSGNAQLSWQTRSHNAVGSNNPPSPQLYRTTSTTVLGRLDVNNSRRMTLNSLIEQRRRGMSKLRGLVIPDKNTESITSHSIIDLPEIKSKEAALITIPNTFTANELKHTTPSNGHQRSSSTSSLSSPPWKTNSVTNTLPKYSPAFKRKSLQVYSTQNKTNYNYTSVPKTESNQNKSSSELCNQLSTPSYYSDKNNDEFEEQNLCEHDKLIKPNIRNIISNFSSELSISEPQKTVPLCDAPKSLESIASPARSDCSFDYTSNSPDFRKCANITRNGDMKSTSLHVETRHFYVNKISLPKHKNDMGRSEDESDNDSAVSSSQSSYISRGCSPLPSLIQDSPLNYRNANTNMLVSPNSSLSSSDDMSSDTKSKPQKTHLTETTISISTQLVLDPNIQSSNNYESLSPRVLKAQSVEAINRKNILASAKCRSGRDLKAGSPLIQRKFDENDNTCVGIIKTITNHCSNRDEDFVLSKQEDEDDGEKSDNIVVHYKVTPDNLENILDKNINVTFIENERNNVDSYVTNEQKDSLCLSSNDLFGIDSCISQLNQTDNRNSNNYSTRKFVSKNEETGECINKAEMACHKNSLCDNDNEQLQNTVAQDLKFDLYSYEAQSPTTLLNIGNNCTSLSDTSAIISSENVVKKRMNSYESSHLNSDNCVSTKDSKAMYLPRYDINKRTSVTDIRKTFEKKLTEQVPMPGVISKNVNKTATNNHTKSSSVDSSASDIFSSAESSSQENNFNSSMNNLASSDFDSTNSSASSSLSPQDLLNLVSEVNQNLNEDGSMHSVNANDVMVVVLHREIVGGSIGITLTGGTDYEAKAITVHKVLNGSPAYKDGRLQKGDRILSINGKSMNGLTHRKSIDILKAPHSEVTLVVLPSRKEISSTSTYKKRESSTVICNNSSISAVTPILPNTNKKSQPVKVMLTKDGAGLGFSLDGGYDSPLGDKPLVIKKIFTGGAAEKCGQLQAGDELLGVNKLDVMKMSRIEVWGLMKKLPEGNVTLTIRRKDP